MNDTRAALNIYAYRYCQTPMGSTVGSWANTGNLANVVSIRWEGTAPSTRESGSFSDTPFPSNMAVQTKMPSADDWVMDPEKGKLLVALVSAVLAIGVFIGVYQVYQAAQYVAPPKKEKKPKTGLNVRKVKKQDAYFKKPAARQDDHQHAFQRLETPEPGFYNHNRSGARDSQYSDAATTFVDWGSNNNGHHQNGHSRYAASDSVSIDMREQSHHQNNRYNNNNATPDLAQFQDMEDPKSTRQRGRGGEVLVPMHTFESNYHHHPSGVGRSPVRRPSSSRSR
ncbi:hypothetical protein BGZ83_007440 [Gryganskiella cystojenkinii]|nr:hypothetical protein BGZ83_007440 [Gryganskiella cystojenkinii]